MHDQLLTLHSSSGEYPCKQRSLPKKMIIFALLINLLIFLAKYFIIMKKNKDTKAKNTKN